MVLFLLNFRNFLETFFLDTFFFLLKKSQPFLCDKDFFPTNKIVK